jgi:sterol desaturase/sphingolipid hydroxylase (fatty acid hydroxylase superfamily)
MNETLLVDWAAQAFTLGVALTLVVLLAEGWWPKARVQAALGRRWRANAVAYATTGAMLLLLPALSLISAAALARSNGWGLFNSISAPRTMSVIVAFLAIDLAGYLVHRLQHVSPLLWRTHRMHHADPDVDVTTTYRFHPFEVLLRAVVAATVAIGIGAPVIAVAVHQLISTVTAVFSHANVNLPARLDAAFNWLFITPNFHRTHHSIDLDDANSNYSVCLSCWDRLFGTFRSAPKLGHANIVFGVDGRPEREATSIARMLADPFLEVGQVVAAPTAPTEAHPS